MGRFFDEHKLVGTVSLCGAWDFATDPEGIGMDEKWYLGLRASEKVNVPSVWNTKLGLLEYVGAAWYQKKFYCEAGRIKLHFGAVMTEADIWLDGDKLESHYGGFCEFDRFAEVTDGYHTLTVRADNSFDQHSVPQRVVDWYHYGGITRDVSYEMLKGIVALTNRFEYTLSEDFKEADCRFKIKLYNAEKHSVTTTVTVLLEDRIVYEGEVTLEGEETKVFTTPDFKEENIRLWDEFTPELYTVCITTDTYDIYDRVGFRFVEVKNGAIYLNGKTYEVRGVNRHECHPDFGMAFPVSLMGRDIDIITEMGCNSIRGSHYPNSREFLDMLDERGITFWSEIPVWGCGFSVESLVDEITAGRMLAMHEEMIERYYNHPSIIIWGMHNEIRSDTENALELTKRIYELIKPIGGNRLITHASYRPFDDICFSYNDFIAINIYYGWYNGTIDSWDEFAVKMRKRRSELGLDDKPVLMSEFGAAAIYGHHTFDNIRWCEEYQANLLEKSIKLFHEDDLFCGFYIWQFANNRTSIEASWNRARGFNNKGILDEYRRPKMAYFKVKELYESFKK